MMPTKGQVFLMCYDSKKQVIKIYKKLKPGRAKYKVL